jgi:TonB family protein
MKKLLFASILVVSCFAASSFTQTKPPKVVKYVAPEYPPAARAVMAVGDVVITVKIDKDGKVISSKAESGHPLLRKASEDAAKEWMFSKDKKIGEREVKLTFEFSPEARKNEKDAAQFKKPYRVIIKGKAPAIEF